MDPNRPKTSGSGRTVHRTHDLTTVKRIDEPDDGNELCSDSKTYKPRSSTVLYKVNSSSKIQVPCTKVTVETQTSESRFDNIEVNKPMTRDNECQTSSNFDNIELDKPTSRDNECQTTSSFDANDIVVMTLEKDQIEKTASQAEQLKQDDTNGSDSGDMVGGRRKKTENVTNVNSQMTSDDVAKPDSIAIDPNAQDDTNDSENETELSGDEVEGRRKKQENVKNDNSTINKASSELKLHLSTGEHVSSPATTSDDVAKPDSIQVNSDAQEPMRSTGTLDVSPVSEDLPINPKMPVIVPNIEFLKDGAIQVNSWADLALFDNCVVLATDRGLCKVDRTTNDILERLSMTSVVAICEIKKSSDIGVVMHQSCIAVVSTDKLAVKYELKIKEPFSKICHLSTDFGGEPDPSYKFALLKSSNATASSTGRIQHETVVFVKAQPDRYDKRLPKPQYSVVVTELSICDQSTRSINGIGSFGSKLVVLCTPEKLICVKIGHKGSAENIWDIELNTNATDIACTKHKAYVCLKDEGKIMMVNKKGVIEMDNILEGKFRANPDRISVYDDTVIMKVFDYSVWASTIRASTNWK